MKSIMTLLGISVFSLMLRAQDEAALVDKVRARLDKVNDYQAKGRMKIDVSFVNAPESPVTVYYKKPDHFKVIKEGGISILPKGGVSVNINALLLNSHYEVVPSKDAVVEGVKTKVVRLLPEDQSNDVVLTTLYIDEKNQVVRKATITTKDNGTYEIGMSYGKFINWGLPDKIVFSFNAKDYKLPKGVTFDYDKGEKKNNAAAKNQKGQVVITYSNYTINKGIDDKVF